MRRYLIFLLTFALLLSCSFTLTKASNYDQAYKDYLYNYNLYRNEQKNYQTAKNQYLSYKTLAAQEKALAATKKFSASRNETLRTYLLALRYKLIDTTGVIDYGENMQFLKLDNNTTWLVTNKENINKVSSLDELLNLTSEFEKNYSDSELLAYQTIGSILFGKEDILREEAKKQSGKIKEQLDVMAKEGEDIKQLTNWLNQANQKIAQSAEKQKEAANLINSLNTNETDKADKLKTCQSLMEESNNYLKEGVSFLSEIVNGIMYE